LVLLRWRNDPDVRAVSRTSGLTSWTDHQRWFASALESPDRVLLVAESAGRRVGTARFDRHSPKEWEVSITLAPEQRGRGLAGKVLAAAETAFREHVDPSANLTAAILPANEASRRLFERAGYDRSDGRTDGAFDVLVKRVERATP
jgi:RimJ/RimL family protein N-acetyltransferase